MHAASDVLTWLETDDARRQAERIAQRWGLGGVDGLPENVLQHARVAVWRRMQSPTDLQVESPAAYGTQVIKSVVRRVSQGRDAVAAASDDAVDVLDTGWEVTAGDRLRVHVEGLAGPALWLTSATLSYVTLLMHPEATPSQAPSPQAGSRPDQGRCWPALWFAGQHDLFDDESSAVRKRRSRRIQAVLDHFDLAADALRCESGATDG